MKLHITPAETSHHQKDLRGFLEQYIKGLITLCELLVCLARFENAREMREADLELAKQRPELYVL